MNLFRTEIMDAFTDVEEAMPMTLFCNSTKEQKHFGTHLQL
jgi:hypothetical protein